LRKNQLSNPNLRGGESVEKANIGSFVVPRDERIENCSTRFLVEKKQNISMSFDPITMLCCSCKAKGAHSVEGGEGGGGAGKFLSCLTRISLLVFPARMETA
jgi:hypothetical protein